MTSRCLIVAHVLLALSLSGCNQSFKQNEVNVNGDGIIGGTEIQKGDPIQKTVVGVYDSVTGELCTGSLLPNNLVLTAAHCIASDYENIEIIFDITLTDDSPYYPVDKGEKSVFFDSRSQKDTNRGDIAILHFEGELPEGYEPAKLMNAFTLEKNTKVIIAGYGVSNGNTGEGAGTLRTTLVAVADPFYAESEVKLNQTMGKGACHGDSGGPAYLKINGQYFVWGITSRGFDDPDNDCSKYSLYTNVIYFNDWINQTVEKLKSDKYKTWYQF